MEHENDIQARLQRMVEEEPNGREAEAALQQLSIFLTEKFGGPAIKLLLPGDRYHQLKIIKTLQKWNFIYTSPRTDQPTSWRDDYLPWDNNYKYWLDPQVLQVFQPSPSDEERHFAFHAARILRFNAGISRKAVEFYLELMDWTFSHKPEIGFSFAKELAIRYGGSDTRFYKRIYQEAVTRERVEEQVRIAYRLASIASRRKDVAFAAEKFRLVLTLGDPETNMTIAYYHSRALEYLGKRAEAEKDWKQARILYERALFLREPFIRENRHTFEVWLRLCHLTDMIGDTEAHYIYGEKVRANLPGGMRYYLQPTTSEDSARRQYLQQMQWHGRRGAPYVLWTWGRFEYRYGHHAEGCRLCQMAVLEFESRFDYVVRGNITDINEYSLIRHNQELYLKELRIGLAQMGCEG